MKINLDTSKKQGKISKYIYGQFAEHLGRCIYEGIYVEDGSVKTINGMRCDVVDALKELEIPVLRWPGGCFADDYHWRDGIGDKSKRPYMVNTNWGGVVENNHFGTHEFFELCDQLGCEPYICGNVGSGTVREMRDWVEYMTFDGDSPLACERRENGREKPWKLKFFGVGNENWGCGGNMRAEYYADEYRRYASFIRDYGDEPIYKIAGGPNEDDAHWMETLMERVGDKAAGISLHNYTYEDDWKNKGKAAQFDEDGYYDLISNALKMDGVISLHKEIMDRFDPERKIGLIVDEWGNWFDVEAGTNPGFLYQQNTMRDALSAMLTLHIFHKHCDRVYMANIAQMVNVLQAMILTDGEKMLLTPTYHLFKMMKGHMDGEKLGVSCDCGEINHRGKKLPKVSVSASERGGAVTVSLCNLSLDSDEETEIVCDRVFSDAKCELMTARSATDTNTFSSPETVVPSSLTLVTEGNSVKLTLPRMSVAVITLS